ncbi:MAG: 50S ribosomal protein L25 [candidate division FCPU426 bacterium]
MSSEHAIIATPRKGSGRRYSSRLRAAGKLPANVYGRGEKPLSVEVDYAEVWLLYRRTIGKNTLLTMRMEGEKDQIVMFKEVQREPVKDKFLHIDFYHVDPQYPIKLKVPVVLEGMPKGVKELGGVLGHPTRFLRVRCLPKDIPAEVKVNVEALGQDESLLLQDVVPPAGVTFLDDKHTVLAHVSVVEEEKAAEPAAGGAAGAAGTPEVIKEKKEGAEGAAAAPAGKGDAKAPAAAAKGAPAAKAAPAAKPKK